MASIEGNRPGKLRTADVQEKLSSRFPGRAGAVNPFYALLVLTATTFTFTALLYVATDLTAAETAGVARLLARHGTLLLFVQGALILVFSVAAMALDSWRWRGTQRIRKGSKK